MSIPVVFGRLFVVPAVGEFLKRHSDVSAEFASMLFYGAIGLVTMLLFEWAGSMIVLDQGAADALYGSTKSLATCTDLASNDCRSVTSLINGDTPEDERRAPASKGQ